MTTLKQMKIVIPGDPMGKPRMTQRDKWAKRPCVLKYRNWADWARLCATNQVRRLPNPEKVDSLSWVAWIAMPPSWSKTKRASLDGRLHKQKPDRDNIDKGLLDAFYKDDSGIAAGALVKRWTSGPPRLEVTIVYET